MWGVAYSIGSVAAREAVDENDRLHRPVRAVGVTAEVLGDDATAVGVREQQVVEVVEEARRCRRVGIWSRRIRQIDQVFARLTMMRT